MLFVLDLDRQKLVDAPGSTNEIASITGKRSEEGIVAVQLVQAGQRVTSAMAVGFGLKFVAKTKDKFDQDPPHVTTADFTWDSATKQYRAIVDWTVTSLNTLFFVDGNDSNDVGQILLGVAVLFRYSDIQKWKESENQVTLTLLNNYGRDEDGDPDDPGDAASEAWLSERAVRYDEPQSLTQAARVQAQQNINLVFTALTGGGAGALDSMVTAGGAVAAPSIFLVVISNELQYWLFREGTEAEDGAGIVRPDDYASTTNEFVFQRVG